METDYNIVNAYFKVPKTIPIKDFQISGNEKLIYKEVLLYDTYPYRPEIIVFNEVKYELSKKLECKVVFEENYYLISNDELNINVWGQTRYEAEEAFSFSFYSLYQNYAKQPDENLTEDAKILKEKLLNLVIKEY